MQPPKDSQLIYGDMCQPFGLRPFSIRSLIRGDGKHWDKYKISPTSVVFELRPGDTEIVEGLL